MEITQLEKAGTAAVLELRRQKLLNGQFFMINSSELSKGECYLEYPDGRIELVRLSGTEKDFLPVRELTNNESLLLRKKHNLL